MDETSKATGAITQEAGGPPMTGYVDEENPEVRLGWRISSINEMEWALSRLADCEARVAEIDAATGEAIARVRARGDKLKAQVQSGAEFFRLSIETFATTERDALLRGGKKGAKSRKMINGSVGWRAKPGRLTVLDEKALTAWCEAQPIEQGFTRVKTEPDLKRVQEHSKTTGEIPDGCEWKSDSETFEVKAHQTEAINVKSAKGA